MIHHLKTWPAYYEAVRLGDKPFELRKDDRTYRVGDSLVLEEYEPPFEGEPGYYTGSRLTRLVTYVLRDAPEFGLKPGFVILGLLTTEHLAGRNH